MDPQAVLERAEMLLQRHAEATFDGNPTWYTEVSEALRHVEDEEAWKLGYPSLDAFYAVYENSHPRIRFYAEDVRRVQSSSFFRNPWHGRPSERLERLRLEDEAG
jgi:hypothetical protein